MENVFQIEYQNKQSSLDGTRFPVREIEGFPDHYFISDGKSHIGGGKLLRKYCVKLEDVKPTDEIRRNVTKRIKALVQMIEEDALKNLDKVLQVDCVKHEDFLKDNDLLAGVLVLNKAQDFKLATPEYVKESDNINRFI